MDDSYFSIICAAPARGGEGEARLRLTLAGEFDLGARDALRDALYRAVEAGGADEIVLDLDGVTFIDSEAISAIIEGLLAARDAGVRLRLERAHGIVARVLDVLGLDAMTDGASGTADDAAGRPGGAAG